MVSNSGLNIIRYLKGCTSGKYDRYQGLVHYGNTARSGSNPYQFTYKVLYLGGLGVVVCLVAIVGICWGCGVA